MRAPVASVAPVFGGVSVPDFGHFNGTQWCLIVVLIFISLVTYDVEHLFIWLFAICPSFLGCPLSHLFKYFLHFLIGLFVFVLLSFEGFVYSGNNPLSDMYFEKIFLPVYSLSFYFLNSLHKATRVLSYLLVSVCVCVCVCVCKMARIWKRDRYKE